MKTLTVKPVSDLRPLGDRTRRMWPFVLLLAALLAGLLLWWWPNPEHQPDSLSESRLVGARGPGCVRLILANDISGSMTQFSAPREDALQQLLTWSPKNLRADDEVAVLDFSGQAMVTMAPSAVGSGPAPRMRSQQFAGTSLAELLRAVTDLPATPCSSALVLLSDGILHDRPDDSETARNQLVSAGLHTVDLLIPGDTIETDEEWPQVYPYAPPTRFDGNDSDSTGLAIGRALGRLTGQRLEAAE